MEKKVRGSDGDSAPDSELDIPSDDGSFEIPDYTEEGNAIPPSYIWKEGEQEKVATMKERLNSDGIDVNWNLHNDHTLKRFLRARGGDVDKGYEMFVTNLKWRKEVGADTILETGLKDNPNIELFNKYWPGTIHKTDKQGDPVYYELLGTTDVKGIIKSVSVEDIMHYRVYSQEERNVLFRDLSNKYGREVEQVLVIEDLAGLGWKHVTPSAIDLFKKIVSISEMAYPESLKRYYILHPPKILPILYRMLSPFVDPATLSKIVICSGNEEEIRKKLLEMIDEENLPSIYGGKCKCKGGCINGGGPFAPYNLRENGTSYNPVSIEISRRSTQEVHVHVNETASYIRWKCSVRKHDIGFGLFHMSGSKKESIVAISKYDDKKEIEGKHRVTQTGEYIFVWDNSHATLRSKSITYQIFVEEDN